MLSGVTEPIFTGFATPVSFCLVLSEGVFWFGIGIKIGVRKPVHG